MEPDLGCRWCGNVATRGISPVAATKQATIWVPCSGLLAPASHRLFFIAKSLVTIVWAVTTERPVFSLMRAMVKRLGITLFHFDYLSNGSSGRWRGVRRQRGLGLPQFFFFFFFF